MECRDKKYAFLHDKRLPKFWEKLERLKQRDMAACRVLKVTPKELSRMRHRTLELLAKFTWNKPNWWN